MTATALPDTEPQVAAGKVLWHFSMSLDGLVAGPGHAMDWMTGFTGREGIIDEYTSTTGAVLGGRTGWDLYPDPTATYGGAWQGPIFVLTHHPDDAAPAEGVTFLSCDVAEEIDLHIAPVLLGDGIRLYDNPGGPRIPLALQDGHEPFVEVNLRYRPAAAHPVTASP